MAFTHCDLAAPRLAALGRQGPLTHRPAEPTGEANFGAFLLQAIGALLFGRGHAACRSLFWSFLEGCALHSCFAKLSSRWYRPLCKGVALGRQKEPTHRSWGLNCRQAPLASLLSTNTYLHLTPTQALFQKKEPGLHPELLVDSQPQEDSLGRKGFLLSFWAVKSPPKVVQETSGRGKLGAGGTGE